MAGTKTNWEISKEEEKGQIETHAKIVALFNPSLLEDIDMKNKNKSARLLLSSEIDSRWLFMKKNFRLLTELNRPGGTYNCWFSFFLSFF